MIGSKFILPNGELRCYVSSDNVSSDALKLLTPFDLIACMAESGLAWEPLQRRGVVLHNMGSASQFGKFGVTAIANDNKV